MIANDFKIATLKQIRWWIWAAVVTPMAALAALFFTWAIAPADWIGVAMVVGQTLMFTIAVVWWWWAMYTLRNLVRQWDTTKVKVIEVLEDVKEIKTFVRDTIITPNDK